MKTLALRLRGAKVELQEAGEDVDGMAESTSQLQAKLKALTHGKVDIMLDANTFKNTTQILREMSEAWEYMTDIERASALELMGGKRQANILSSVITNFDTVESVIQTSLESTGSAYAENERWLDSIEGKTNRFTNSLQKFWNNLISSDTVKFVVDQGTDLIELLDTGHGKILAIAAALKVFGKIKGVGFGGVVSSLVSQVKGITGAYQSLQTLGKTNPIKGPKDFTNLDAYANAVAGLTAKQQASLLAYQGLNKAQIANVLSTNNVEKAKAREALAYIKTKEAKDQDTAATQRQIKQDAKSVANTLKRTAATAEGAEKEQLQAAATILSTTSVENLNRANLEAAFTAAGVNKELQKQIFVMMGMQTQGEKTAMTLKALWATNKGAIISTVVTAAVTGLTMLFNKLSESAKNLKEQYDELQSSISDAESDIGAIDSELESVQEKIDSFANKNLSIADAEELKALKEQSEELERQKELQEKILKAREKQNSVKSVSMINDLLKTTAANQERAAESGKVWGYVIGGVLATVGAIAAMWSGGTSLILSKVGLGIIASSAALGAAIGGHGGEKIGSNSKASDGTLIGWYNSYEEALQKASQEASKAEQEYLTSRSDKTYKAWQDKLDEVNTLQTEMYDGLQQMQEYVDNLEYNDQTKGTIDEYNKLLAHIDVTSNEGNIDGQISSIESLRSEYEELSRGVNEHGENVALTAQEYARYCVIVDQLLAYNSGIYKSYDENGNVILKAGEAQVAYNQIIEETIRLLKEQQRQAAITAIDGKDNDQKPLYDAYKSAKKYTKSFKPEAVAGYEFGGTKYAGDYIGDVIGVDHAWYQDLDKYIYENIDAISTHLDEIMLKAKAGGMDDGELEIFREYLESAIEYANSNILESEFKKTLYLIPQLSEKYNELTGSQLAFVNGYISSLEVTDNMTEKQLKEMRDDIVKLVDDIGGKKNAQDAIQDFYKIDTSKIPVSAYTEELKKLGDTLVKEGVIESVDANKDGINDIVYNMFVGDDNLDEMQKAVESKLKVASKGLAKTLSVQELQIAYKMRIDLEDDSLTYEELKQKIAEAMPKASGPIVQSYSTLKQQVSDLNAVFQQSSDIVLNNTKVTQEYKDSLIALGVSETDLAECFDSTNNLVVTNAEKLKEITEKAKKNTAQNAKLAKSQARLQYYELSKEMKKCFDANGNIIDGSEDTVKALYDEMNAIEKTIAKYSLLEAQLLGATNAYDALAAAQESDSEIDFGSKAEEMMQVLGDALNTGELGTEAAQVAIEGLIPESVFEDCDTLQEKMDAIFKYFTSGPVTQLFKIEFDDDGNISSVDMDRKNLKSTVNSLTQGPNKVFTGSWDEGFDLDESITSLDEFAQKIGVTKEVAFAFLTELEKYDISWLDGDYSTFLDQFLAETNEGKIQLYTQYIADLAAEQAKIEKELFNEQQKPINEQDQAKIDEYTKKIDELKKKREEYNSELNVAKTDSKNAILGADGYEVKRDISQVKTEDIDNYIDGQAKVVQLQEEASVAEAELAKAEEELNKARKDSTKTQAEIKALEEDYAAKTKKTLEKQAEVAKAILKRDEFSKPTVLEIQMALDDIDNQIKQAAGKYDEELQKYFLIDNNGYYYINTELKSELEKNENYDEIINYVNLLNSKTQLTATVNDTEAVATLDDIIDKVSDVVQALENIKISLDEQSKVTFKKDLENLFSAGGLWKMGVHFFSGDYWAEANGTANANGTAFAGGNWGAPKTEKALVGELGTELLVRGNRWTTIGENGAEFTDVRKGDIIFNHKQTEQLLKNGHISGRGRAFASGTAYAVSTYNNKSLSSSYGNSNSSSKSSDEPEVFDWFEISLEKINQQIDLMNAKLENTVGISAKGSIIDMLLGDNNNKIQELNKGIKLYEDYANQLYNEIPAQYRNSSVINGKLDISEFSGDSGKAALDAINNYREWADKVSDLKQQLVETETEAANLAKQKFDVVSEDYDNQIGLLQNANDQLEAQVSLMEDEGNVASAEYYEQMITNSSVIQGQLQEEKKALQSVLDEQVKNGNVKVGSEQWYEMVQAIYDVDAEIVECTSDIEGFKNSINDIKWDNFNQLIDRLDALNDETQNFIDLLEQSGDLVDEQGNWTKEGMASLGLYAQQMEVAQFEAQQYADAIQDLKANQDKYSKSEYAEKMEELTNAQYDSIDAYYEAQDAIVDLNKERVDAIKNGIDKEVEAYEELINKKKEALDADKDMHDFQKTVMEQEKEISTIQRKLAAIANDNSMSANAKRARLEADLAKAKENLEETYYDRSVQNQKDALDDQLEKFKDEKDAEKEKWDAYLEDVKLVVADALGIVQENATDIATTLDEKAKEYNVTLSDAILSPWQSGATAVGSYQTAFDTATSATTQKLKEIKEGWQDVINKSNEAAGAEKKAQEANNAKITAATETPKTTTPTKTTTTTPTSTTTAKTQEKAIVVGGKINAKGAKIYSSIGSKALNQYYSSDPIYTVLEEKNGYLRVRYHKSKSGTTGWFKKADVKAYAKGTSGLDKDQLAWIDEMGLEELVMHAGPNGRLQYLTKGTSVIPHDITENLMALGKLDPSEVLSRNTPQIGVHPEIHNTEISVHMDIAEVVHVDTVTNDTIPDLTKAVKKQIDDYVKQMNKDIRKYTR